MISSLITKKDSILIIRINLIIIKTNIIKNTINNTMEIEKIKIINIIKNIIKTENLKFILNIYQKINL